MDLPDNSCRRLKQTTPEEPQDKRRDKMKRNEDQRIGVLISVFKGFRQRRFVAVPCNRERINTNTRLFARAVTGS